MNSHLTQARNHAIMEDLGLYMGSVAEANRESSANKITEKARSIVENFFLD